MQVLVKKKEIAAAEIKPMTSSSRGNHSNHRTNTATQDLKKKFLYFKNVFIKKYSSSGFRNPHQDVEKVFEPYRLSVSITKKTLGASNAVVQLLNAAAAAAAGPTVSASTVC